MLSSSKKVLPIHCITFTTDKRNRIVNRSQPSSKLILNGIKSIETNKEVYPSADEIMSVESNLNCVPSSLHDFLKHIIDSKRSEILEDFISWSGNLSISNQPASN